MASLIASTTPELKHIGGSPTPLDENNNGLRWARVCRILGIQPTLDQTNKPLDENMAEVGP